MPQTLLVSCLCSVPCIHPYLHSAAVCSDPTCPQPYPNLSWKTRSCLLPLHMAPCLTARAAQAPTPQNILCTLLPPLPSLRRPCCAGAVQVMAECIDAVLRIADSGGHVAPALMQVCSIVKVRRARRPRPDAGTRARDGARTDAALLQYSHALCGACRPCHIWASLIGGLPSLYSPPFRGITCHILIWALLSLAPPSGDPASDML